MCEASQKNRMLLQTVLFVIILFKWIVIIIKTLVHSANGLSIFIYLNEPVVLHIQKETAYYCKIRWITWKEKFWRTALVAFFHAAIWGHKLEIFHGNIKTQNITLSQVFWVHLIDLCEYRHNVYHFTPLVESVSVTGQVDLFLGDSAVKRRQEAMMKGPQTWTQIAPYAGELPTKLWV